MRRDEQTSRHITTQLDMSARQLNRLAKAKGSLDPLLSVGFNSESDDSDEQEDSEEEETNFSRGGAVSVLVRTDWSTDVPITGTPQDVFFRLGGSRAELPCIEHLVGLPR